MLMRNGLTQLGYSTSISMTDRFLLFMRKVGMSLILQSEHSPPLSLFEHRLGWFKVTEVYILAY